MKKKRICVVKNMSRLGIDVFDNESSLKIYLFIKLESFGKNQKWKPNGL